jgi:hypothetical protein
MINNQKNNQADINDRNQINYRDQLEQKQMQMQQFFNVVAVGPFAGGDPSAPFVLHDPFAVDEVELVGRKPRPKRLPNRRDVQQ